VRRHGPMVLGDKHRGDSRVHRLRVHGPHR
jgi:hypothetical protein